eukprot:CAMPEP_0170754694 /NCGR_PEP_ID=MMETSP0437-20130122/13134_1 /TAXON_ID=0 /ORGANISM="Sexangularia sp." /LENGTH=55 /DNA_ID=CAMNT_0011093839 /DNA_START=238 /DNA_END=405 /DNA_ORIENTATION=-
MTSVGFRRIDKVAEERREDVARHCQGLTVRASRQSRTLGRWADNVDVDGHSVQDG